MQHDALQRAVESLADEHCELFAWPTLCRPIHPEFGEAGDGELISELGRQQFVDRCCARPELLCPVSRSRGSWSEPRELEFATGEACSVQLQTDSAAQLLFATGAGMFSTVIDSQCQLYRQPVPVI